MYNTHHVSFISHAGEFSFGFPHECTPQCRQADHTPRAAFFQGQTRPSRSRLMERCASTAKPPPVVGRDGHPTLALQRDDSPSSPVSPPFTFERSGNTKTRSLYSSRSTLNDYLSCLRTSVHFLIYASCPKIVLWEEQQVDTFDGTASGREAGKRYLGATDQLLPSLPRRHAVKVAWKFRMVSRDKLVEVRHVISNEWMAGNLSSFTVSHRC